MMETAWNFDSGGRGLAGGGGFFKPNSSPSDHLAIAVTVSVQGAYLHKSGSDDIVPAAQ
jgi:hypothetical protein